MRVTHAARLKCFCSFCASNTAPLAQRTVPCIVTCNQQPLAFSSGERIAVPVNDHERCRVTKICHMSICAGNAQTTIRSRVWLCTCNTTPKGGRQCAADGK